MSQRTTARSPADQVVYFGWDLSKSSKLPWKATKKSSFIHQKNSSVSFIQWVHSVILYNNFTHIWSFWTFYPFEELFIPFLCLPGSSPIVPRKVSLCGFVHYWHQIVHLALVGLLWRNCPHQPPETFLDGERNGDLQQNKICQSFSSLPLKQLRCFHKESAVALKVFPGDKFTFREDELFS